MFCIFHKYIVGFGGQVLLIKAKWSTAAGGSHQRSKERYFVNRELKYFKTQSAFSIYVTDS